MLVGQDKNANQATVTYVSPIIDPDSGLGRIDIKIDNRDLSIQSGIICFWADDNFSQANAEPQSNGDDYLINR